MLGKLVWQLHNNSDKLCVELVSQKYIRQQHFLQLTKKAGSFTQNSILKAKAVLNEGFGFRLGNGDTSIWYVPWLDSKKLSAQVPFVDIHDIHLQIKDVINDGKWNLDKLYTSLPSDATDAIFNISPLLHHDVPDMFIWTNNSDGCYSAKEGYKWLLERRQSLSMQNNIIVSWNWIWQLASPEKIKFLIWLACHDSLPIMSTLHKRGMSSTSTCQRCHTDNEDILHCFRDCTISRQLWRSLKVTNASCFGEMNHHLWLKNGATGPDSCAFQAAIWWIWRARNTITLAGEEFPLYRYKQTLAAIFS